MTPPVQTWRYTVPGAADGSDCGGTFVLCSDGYFSCVTDWGNYAFQWRSFGPRDFRAFLTELRTDYLIGKLAPERSYDGEATYEKIVGHIEELRKAKSISAHRARTERDLAEHKHGRLDEPYNYYKWAEETTLEESREFYCVSHNAQALSFCNKLYPRLVALLKADLQETHP